MNKTLEMNDSQVNLIDYLYCEADKSKLGKVFRNLFSNAMKFTGKGGRIVATACALIPIKEYEQRKDPSPRPFASNAVFPAVEGIGREQSRATHMLRIEVSDDGAGLSKV